MRNPSVSQKSNIHGKKENTFFHFRRPSFLVSFSGFSGRAAQIKPANHSSFWWCNLRIPFHPEIIYPPYAYCRGWQPFSKSPKKFPALFPILKVNGFSELPKMSKKVMLSIPNFALCIYSSSLSSEKSLFSTFLAILRSNWLKECETQQEHFWLLEKVCHS